MTKIISNFQRRLLHLGVVLAVLVGCDQAAIAGLQAPPLRGSLGAHDPGSIIKCKDKYYIFYTGQNISWKSSTDKVFWTEGGHVFAHPPNWTTNAAPGFTDIIWAPDVFYLNSRYCLYYAVSTLGSQVSGIGLVTNPTLDPTDPTYLWTDQGPVITSVNGSAYNTIDPSATFDASGNPWLCFGSYWNGIYVVQLDPLTGLRISANSPTTRLAYNSSIEASCIFRRGGYYYLMADWGSCCSGVNSTYNIRMGRSTSITGPYLDRNGVDMVNNGGSIFLQGTGKFTGPGHFAILSEGGTQWFSYHYYDAGAYAPWYNAYGVADFDLEPLSWTVDNWPYFTNDWSAVYNFQNDARDDNGQYYGLLRNGASIQTDSLHSRVLNLNGTNQYVQLPPGVAFARTFSAVVKWNGGDAWQRIFDFGVDTANYVMLTPLANDGKLHCDIRVNNVTQTIAAPAPLPIGVWTHVALTLDGAKGIIYSNGVPVVTNAITFSPLDVLAETNHLGHSKFVTDPDFNGKFANFRVYGRALLATEIVAPQPVIAQPADGSTYWPGTTISFNGSATDFADLPLTNSALSWRVEYLNYTQTNVVFGPVAGITNGTFTIPTNATDGGTYRIVLTATDGAARPGSTSALLTPANPPTGWSAYYPFKANASDANGHFNGTFNGGASIQNDATRGNVLNLSGANQFVSLPTGISQLQTFMAWVKWNGGGAWQRIFDFGNDTTRYAVLTPSAANGKMRYNISVASNGAGQEQITDAPSPLPVGVWTHVAMTTDGSMTMLYTNGVPVATNANNNLVPANLNATNNYLGKSQFPDPYFSGQMSAVRIFSTALSAAQIVAPQITIAQPAHGALYSPGSTINFSGGANDFSDAAIPASSFTWSVQWRYNGSTNTVIAALTGVTNGSFAIPATGTAATNAIYRISLSAVDSASRRSTNFVDIFPVSSAVSGDWSSYYPFTSNANDASNRFNGTLTGGASIQPDATRGSVLNLSGASQYVNFATGIGSARTFGGWVKWRGGNPWQRIFDFGQDTQRFFFLCPYTGGGLLQCAITAQASNYTQVVEAAPLPQNVWTHVAVTLDGRQAILYTNGQVAAVNNSINLLPSDVGATKNYFGRSQYAADAYFNGQLDSVKINSRSLSPAEIFAPTLAIIKPTNTLYAGGDNIAYAGVGTDFSDAFLSPTNYTWSAEFRHDGITDSFLAPTSGATNGTLAIPTTGPNSTNVFYRLYLRVTDTNGNQQSTFVDIPPRIAALNLASVPTGLQLSVDGQTMNAPTAIVAVAGMTRTLNAPSPQNFAGSNYNFVVWSDGGAQTHGISVPTNGTTFTASYVQPTLSLNSLSQGALTLQWPAWSAPFSLWSATNLASPTIWQQVTNAPVSTNGNLLLTLSATNGSLFYRLQFP